MKNLLRSDKGTVMMEYIVLNFFILVVLIASGQLVTTSGDNLGSFAGAWLTRYRLMLHVVSFPFP